MEKYYADPTGRVRVRGEEMWIQLDQKPTAVLGALDGFSHLNTFWWFSDSDNEEMRNALETPQPYKGTPETMDIFATHPPIRPNPIVLTTVEMLSTGYETGVIRIAYIDINDGTPALDIKPYTPSLDHVWDPAVPGWCGNWPSSLEEPGEFDWKLVFNL